MLMQSALVALLLAAPAAEPVTVTRLDGSVLAGELTAVTNDHVDVDSSDGPVAVPLDQLLSIQWDRPVVAPVEGAAVVVATLIDGSSLNLAGFQVEGDAAVLETPWSVEPIRVPRSLVHHVRFGKLETALQAGWEELATRNSRDDLLVFNKDGVLDYVGGVVGKITAEQVTLLARGRELATPRERVFGVVYAGRKPPREKLTAEVVLTTGDRLQAGALTRGENGWNITLRSGLALPPQLQTVSLIDFGGGRLRYLSDLAYDDTASTDPNPDFPGGSVVWFISNDSPIGLGVKGLPLRIGKEDFRRGVWLHSGAVIRYRLGREYRKLQATAGFELSDQDRMPRFDPRVKLVIEGDGRELYAREFGWQDEPQPLDVDVADVRDLTVRVISLGKYKGILERFALGNAKLVK